MKKALFIDRDGTLVIEPKPSEQLDSLEQLEFLPSVIRNLYKIRKEFDYELVIVTNQDGLGTESFPLENFYLAHNKMLEIFKNEGITFENILIDDSFPYQKKNTRKPEIGMLTSYMKGNYDLKNSFVIGDRITDLQLAKNLGAKGILISKNEIPENLKEICVLKTQCWDEIYHFFRFEERTAEIERKTNETLISIKLSLDSDFSSSFNTGIAFFDHMLDQIAKHGNISLQIKVKGDLNVDEHHTIEDTAIALGEVFKKALGNKIGMERYGFSLPMDESSAKVLLDFGGRSYFVWKADFQRERVGEMPTEMFKHFFKSFSDSAQCNLHIEAEGENEHHKIEAIFKAFARAIKMAILRNPFNGLPSTKGTL